MSDQLTCSICGGVSYNVLDFLNHKAQHAAPGAGIHCEFCKISYTRTVTLKEHYRIKHKILFADGRQVKSAGRTRQKKKMAKEQTQSAGDFVTFGKETNVIIEDTTNDIVNMSHIADKESNLESGHEGMSSAAIIIMSSHNGTTLNASRSLDAQSGTHILSSDTDFSSSLACNHDGSPLNASKSLDTQCNTHIMASNTDADFTSSLACHVEHSSTQLDETRLVQGATNPHDPGEFLFSNQNAVHVVLGRSSHDHIMTNGICSLMSGSDLHDKSHSLSQGYDDFNMTSGSVQLPYVIPQHGDLCDLESMENDPTSVHVILEKDSCPTSLTSGELMSMCGGDSNGDLLTQQLEQSESGVDIMCNAAVISKSPVDDFHFILLTDVVEGSSLTYGKQAFRCLHCEYQSSWKNGLCRHMREEHPDTLSLHQAIQIKTAHTDSNRTVMKMSEYSAMQMLWKSKAAHPRTRGVEKQDLPGSFTCPKCDKVFNRLRYLRKHQVVHRTDQKFLCDECGKAFKTKAYLNQHRRVHKKEAYSCNECDFTSSINSMIHEHRQVHNKGCVLCEVCGTAYFDKSTLAKHKLVHDVSRPYPCTYPECTWRFRNEVMCRAHIRNHTTKGKFKCTICGYVFRHKHHLQRHEEKMHGIVIPKTWSKKNTDEGKLDTVEEITDTINLIVDPDIHGDQLTLQNALHANQLVIATDSEGNSINYEVADIAMNVAYQTLLAGTDGHSVDTHTILIPHQSDCSHIVLQHESESVIETVQ